MADWLDQDVGLNANTAALIAFDMRQVAMVDGRIHQRELALIDSFESQLPRGGDKASASLDTPELRQTYVRSLTMVALADGKISPPEEEVVRSLAAANGLSKGEVDASILDVKRRFLRVFAGVRVFRESVLDVARDLGLPESEVDALLDESKS